MSSAVSRAEMCALLKSTCTALRRDPRRARPGLEPLGRLQPHGLPLLLLRGRQPAPLRIPHEAVVPQGSPLITTARISPIQPE